VSDTPRPDDILEQGAVYRLRPDGPDLVAYHGQADGPDGQPADGWVLYTAAEWDSGTAADLEVTPAGVITFQGAPTGYRAVDLVATGRFRS